jgi:E3 ubiquitin-protein ligase SHPRH
VKGDELKKAAAALKEGNENPLHENMAAEQDAAPSLDKGKGKNREQSPPPSSSTNLDSDDHDLPRTPAVEEHGIKRRALQHRLRESFVTLHRVKFLEGDVYHVLGASHGPDEDAAYASAEEIRRNLLKSWLLARVGTISY